MPINHTRLDRLLSKHFNVKRRDIQLMLAQRRVCVDGLVILDGQVIVNQFSKVTVGDRIIQGKQPSYWMLHKPIGVVSATSDTKHRTVLDLLDCPAKSELHIVGRLDLNTSGLVLLTNDSRWSSAITAPEQKVAKHYHVTLQNPINEEYVTAFAQGMYFSYENLTTLPAELTILSSHCARVKLLEGRYHQIKRMFGRFRNPVVGLHRYQIGAISLDENLAIGESRLLTSWEVESVYRT